MKVISYLATLPAKQLAIHPPTEKISTLHYYIQGVNAVGDQGIVSYQPQWEPCDVAVILGWVHEHGKTAPHLSFRREIVERQRATGGRTIIADSNLFLYKNTANPGYWLRYSFDGVFPDTGEYCDQTPDPERWKIISQSLGLTLRPWRDHGNHILLCLQRQGGWSMGNNNTVDWAIETIETARQYSDRQIVVRGHPGDRQSARQIKEILDRCRGKNIKKISHSVNTDLANDFKHCWAVVNHNSSPTIGAAIEGLPVFVTDPLRSQARDIANTDLSQLETPLMPDRQRWVERISQFHWGHQDIQTGRCWLHMKQWVHK